MIAHLRGIVLLQEETGVVVECNGVGYGVFMSVSALTRTPPIGQELSVFIYTHVAEESLRLYGFLTPLEKRVFEILLGTSGVGPKLALAIMGAILPADLIYAVHTQDKGALTRIPGVGGKKAERLLVELKGRLDPLTHLASASSTRSSPIASPSLQDDLLSALENLGFAKPVAERAAAAALHAFPEAQDLAQLVREALRRTTARAQG